MTGITIEIHESDEGGYYYTIYGQELDAIVSGEDLDDRDGGQCTTTMLNALGMATEQAAALIKSEKGDECPGCNSRMGEKTERALSRYGHGELCSECGTREAMEGDFIGSR